MTQECHSINDVNYLAGGWKKVHSKIVQSSSQPNTPKTKTKHSYPYMSLPQRHKSDESLHNHTLLLTAKVQQVTWVCVSISICMALRLCSLHTVLWPKIRGQEAQSSCLATKWTKLLVNQQREYCQGAQPDLCTILPWNQEPQLLERLTTDRPASYAAFEPQTTQ